MKLIYSFVTILGIIAGVSTHVILAPPDPVCPNPDIIWPCTCNWTRNGIELACMDSSITQDSIDRMFEHYIANNSWTSPVRIFEFRLTSNLTTLDMTPLMTNITMRQLAIVDNPNLNSITGPSLETHRGIMEVVNLYLDENIQIRPEVMGIILSYISPMELTVLGLSRNELRDVPDGISNFTNLVVLDLQSNLISSVHEDQFQYLTSLTRLYLQHNNISIIADGQFKNLVSLNHLDLMNNPIQMIGERAFDLDEVSPWRYINLTDCGITDEMIDENTYLHVNSAASLILTRNELNTISSAKFEGFLRAYWSNRILLDGNPIICDERVKWLKDNKDTFEDNVINAWCINDPGNHVFNSTKIQ